MDEEKALEEFMALMDMDTAELTKKTSDAISEVMSKLEDLQKTIQQNRAILHVVDFACLIGMSVMGPVNIEHPEERTEEYPGHLLTRTLVGSNTDCKALSIILTKSIAHAEKEADNG